MIGRQEGAFTPYRLRKEKSFREHQKGFRGTQKSLREEFNEIQNCPGLMLVILVIIQIQLAMMVQIELVLVQIELVLVQIRQNLWVLIRMVNLKTSLPYFSR